MTTNNKSLSHAAPRGKAGRDGDSNDMAEQ